MRGLIVTVLFFFMLQGIAAQTTGCSDSTFVYGLNYNSQLGLYKRLQLKNGDFVLYDIRSKTSGFNPSTSYVVKTDSNGIYKKGYEVKINGAPNQRFNFAVSMPDGGFTLIGDKHYYQPPNGSGGFQKVVAVRFDADMNIIWNKEFQPIADPVNYDENAPFAITAACTDEDGNLYGALIMGSSFGYFPYQPNDLSGNVQFIFCLKPNGDIKWSNRFEHATFEIAGNYTAILTSIIKINNKLFFWGEAQQAFGYPYSKQGAFNIIIDAETRMPLSSDYYSLPEIESDIYGYNFPAYALQKTIAYNLNQNNQGVIFKYCKPVTGGYKNMLVNITFNALGSITKSRKIIRSLQLYKNTASERSKTEAVLLPNNTMVFVEDMQQPRLIAVIDSSNKILTSKLLSSYVSANPEINGITFTKNNEALNLHVLDTTSTNRVQMVQLNINGSNITTSNDCNMMDSLFFTIDTAIIQQTGLSIRGIHNNFVTTQNVSVTLNPFILNTSTLCKTYSACDTINIAGPTEMCIGEAYNFIVYKNPDCKRNIDFTLIDETIFTISNKTSTGFTITPKASWEGYLKIGFVNCILRDSLQIKVYKKIAPFSLGVDAKLCKNATTTLQLPLGYKQYLWNNNTTEPILTVTMPGTYIATVWDGCNNFLSDTIIISAAPDIPIDLGTDTSICKQQNLTLNAGNGFTNYSWSNGAISQIININTAGVYAVQAVDVNGCMVKDTLRLLNVYDLPVINLSKATIICKNNPLLNAGSGYANYLWQDGNTNSTYTVVQPGKYKVVVTNSQGCTASDSVIVNAIELNPADFLPKDTLYCIDENKILSATKNYTNYLWNTFAVTKAISVAGSGLYTLQVTDANGCVGKDTTIVKVEECPDKIWFPTAFTPNNDGLNDTYRPIVQGILISYDLQIFNRLGEKIFETRKWQNGWNGTYKGTIQPNATYVYTCKYQFRNNEMKQSKGNIVILK